MAFPEDAVTPLLTCMNPSITWPPIGGPGGLPNFALSGFTSMFAGVNFILDFIPPDPMNLPSPPSPLIFTDAFLGSLSIPGDIGEIDFSVVIPGGPTIPATGTNILFDQTGMINLMLMTVAAPFEIILGIVTGIIDDLIVSLPTLSGIVAILDALALALLFSGVSVTAFITCFATGLLDMITSLIPV